MLLPRVGVWLVCVKKWSCNASINGSSLAPEALSTESQNNNVIKQKLTVTVMTFADPHFMILRFLRF